MFEKVFIFMLVSLFFYCMLYGIVNRICNSIERAKIYSHPEMVEKLFNIIKDELTKKPKF